MADPQTGQRHRAGMKRASFEHLAACLYCSLVVSPTSLQLVRQRITSRSAEISASVIRCPQRATRRFSPQTKRRPHKAAPQGKDNGNVGVTGKTDNPSSPSFLQGLSCDAPGLPCGCP